MRKDWDEMTREEKLEHFSVAMKSAVDTAGGNVDGLRNRLVLTVRHFVAPRDHALAMELMARAAQLCGDALDADGVWAPCRGEVWLRDALALAQ